MSVRGSRTGSLAGQLPLSVLEPDGLMVTTENRYVRLIQCDQVPNTITADPGALSRIKDAYQALCRIIPDGQSIIIYAQTDPVPIEDALAGDEHATRVAAGQDVRDGHPELARARSWLYEATRQTVIAAAGAEQPAVTARWWVAVPYQPVSEDPRRRLRDGLAGARGRTLWATHRDAAIESLRITEQIDAALRRAGIDTWLMDGPQTTALLWERLHPGADTLPDLQALGEVCKIADATTPADAARDRHRILEAIADGARWDLGENPNWVRHHDGTLEETIHLATPPAATDPSWLAHLLTCPLPATLAVHIEVGQRSREAARQRRRWQRLRAAVRYKERRDRLVGSDEEDALQEAAVVDAELAASVGASVYRVGIYCSIRDPRGDAERLRGSCVRPARTSIRSPTRGCSAGGTSLGMALSPRCRSAPMRSGRGGAMGSATSLTVSRCPRAGADAPAG
jgi:hypothetical protein